MSRAVLLPSPADPFLLQYWSRQVDRVWGKHIDKIYIYLNSPILKNFDVIDWFHQRIFQGKKYYILINDAQIPHGEAINRLLDIVTEDYVMLIEDDAIIVNPRLLIKSFEFIENGTYDVVGSKRGSCSQEILDRAASIWGLRYDGVGDQGCNLWPNFLFTRTEILKSTDRNFDSRAWKQGEYLEWLNWVVDVPIVVGDTFVNTSLQFLHKGLKIGYVPQYHGNLTDIEDSMADQGLFDGACPWFHIGSLSSGIGGVLTDVYNRPLAEIYAMGAMMREKGPSYCNSEAEKIEWERRVQWWLTFYEEAKDIPKRMQHFHGMYKDAIYKLIAEYGLNMKHIRVRQRLFKERITHVLYD